MKNMQRLFSILLALILIFSLWSPAYAVEGSGIKLTMETSYSSIQVGDTVEIAIRTDKDFATRGSGMTVYYDAEKLELDLENSTTAEPFRIDPVTVNGKTAIRISFLPG